MKIFAFTDIHGDLKIIDNILIKIKQTKPDLIICAGDISNFSQNLEKIILKFKTTKIPFIIIPGNHETAEEIRDISKKHDFMINLHKKSYKINDYIFFGYGLGGFSQQDKEFEEITKNFKKTIKDNQKIILITHAPPYNTQLDKIPVIGHCGSRSIRKFIDDVQPILHLCGHFHENDSKIDKINNTRILNPGNGKFLTI